MNKIVLFFCLFFTVFTPIKSQVSSSNLQNSDTATINALITRIEALEIANANFESSYNIEEEILVFASAKQANTTTVQARNCVIGKISTGRYQVKFFESHPDAERYEVTTGVEEDNNRDVPKAFVEAGSQTKDGFIIAITVDDNGGSADIYRDDTFSFSIPYQKKIHTNAN